MMKMKTEGLLQPKKETLKAPKKKAKKPPVKAEPIIHITGNSVSKLIEEYDK